MMLLSRSRLTVTLFSLLSGLQLSPLQAWQGPAPMGYGYYQPMPPQPAGYIPYYGPVNYPQPYWTAPGYYRPQPTPVYRYPAPPVSEHQVPGLLPQKASITKALTRPSTDPVITKPAVTSKPKNGHKKQFTEQLLPFIEQENRRLLQLRARLAKTIERIKQGHSLESHTRSWLEKLARQYRVNNNPLTSDEARQKLLMKVDIIPTSLALAQAANESAWGKSRFATEANNLYGIWTYDEAKGLKPKHRDKNQTHLVRIFDHFGDSVEYYMHTLNSHPAYKKLREIRASARLKGDTLDGHAMAEGLEKYSGIGDKYIRIIQSMIRQNQWHDLDRNHSPA